MTFTLAGSLRLGSPVVAPRIQTLPDVAFKTLNYYFATGQSATSTAVIAAGGLRLSPFYVAKRVGISRLGAEVTVVGDSGSKVRLGIYADTGTGEPGALVLDAGQIAGDSATVQEITLGATLYLDPGWYWFGAVTQSVTTTAPTIRVLGASGLGLANSFPLSAGTSIPAANATVNGYQQTGVTAALPATLTTLATVASVPRLFFKVA